MPPRPQKQEAVIDFFPFYLSMQVIWDGVRSVGGLCKQRGLAWGMDGTKLVMHSYYSFGPNTDIDPPGQTG